MDLLLKNITIFYPGHELHQHVTSIMVQDGRIDRIGQNIRSAKAETIELKDTFLSPGWLDINTFVGEPGFEHRESLETIVRSAHRGGFTSIAPAPNTLPVADRKTAMHFLLKQQKLLGLNLHPIGAITVGGEGVDIAEMIDMHHAGAVGFSDGLTPIQNNGVMMRALQYIKTIDGIVLNHPHYYTIAEEGLIHEGAVSTSLGMKGIPSLAEKLMVQRDIDLLDYTDSKLHILNISSGDSIPLIEQGKKKKLNLTASVPVMNLVATDQDCENFRYEFKVLPPLRSTADRKALFQAVKKGIIDGITTNHVPVDEESKNLEFAHAAFGAIGLETAFALLNTHYPNNIDLWIDCLAFRNRKILGLDIPALSKGSLAEFTLFNPTEEWTFSKSDIGSKSQNTPYLGTQFTGRVKGVVVGKEYKFWE